MIRVSSDVPNWWTKSFLGSSTGRETGVPVLLNGRAGIGKTVMSGELAHRQRSRYVDVGWIDAAAAGSGRLAERVDACLAAFHGGTGPRLLVLDGVSTPEDVVGCLPRDETRVLITSRTDAGLWHRVARVIQVPVLSRNESVCLLRTLVPALGEDDALRLAGALDDLPLALENAASWLTSGMTPQQVLEQLEASASSLLGGCRSTDFPRSLAGRLSEAMKALATGSQEERWMLRLLHALAVLGPKPFPTRALRGDRWEMPDGESQYLLTLPTLHRRLGGLHDRGLINLRAGWAELDDISGAVIRDLLAARRQDQAGAFALAEQLLVAAVPERAASEEAWSDWALAAPPVLAFDPASIQTGPGRKALLDTYSYLVDSGRYMEAIDGLGKLRAAWAEYLTCHRDDDLVVMSVLARAHFGCGHFEDAEQLNLQVYWEREEKLGPRHPGTLEASVCYALDLGAKGYYSEACNLAEQSWLEQCRLFGQESRQAMRTASHMARLRTPQDPDHAYHLGRRVHRLQVKHLGVHHQHTLDTAHHLALCLVALNEFRQALPLLKETLKYRRDTLPPGHPDTLWTAAHYYLLSADLGRQVPQSALRGTYDGLRGFFDGDHQVVRLLAAMAEC
ncbi:tetratricopeptide repeat protein [Streptomyces sp. NPDC048288]|uniref:tetratricopeptide repeat protein n=1 Tax=Streptomyces sp. NPDC048288 TaxID=3365529 RepID=UPI003722177A